MKRTVITMIVSLRYMSGSIAQTNEQSILVKSFATFSTDDTFHPYEFTHRAVSDNNIQIEMLNYSVTHGICSEVEMIRAKESEIDKDWRDASKGRVKFHNVIDMSTLK